MAVEARWWQVQGDVVHCGLCPHGCHLTPGSTGRCSVRRNDHGVLTALSYGLLSAIALDPVEKKPLYHWHPGRTILSLGGVGCSMDCPFCQNWPIARWNAEVRPFRATPSRILSWARDNGTHLVAFTYNEPLTAFEFLAECLPFLKGHGVETVLVTNGQIAPEPLAELLPSLDGANVDLKAFNARSYGAMGGDLKTTMATIQAMIEAGVHVEVSWLAVPGLSDDPDDFRSMTTWLARRSPPPPLHVQRYFPAHRWTAPPTDESLMDLLVRIALERLPRVYQGNRPGAQKTTCLRCGASLVVRWGHGVDRSGLMDDGRCAACGAPSDIQP